MRCEVRREGKHQQNSSRTRWVKQNCDIMAGYSVEPLALLRKCVSRKLPISREGQQLVFGNRKFHVKTPTRIKKGDSGHYDLGAVWFWVCCSRASGAAEYLRGAQQNGVETINFGDREAVKKYVTGETETIPQLDSAPVPAAPAPAAYARQQRQEQQQPATSFEAVLARSGAHDIAWRKYEDVVKREIVLQDRCNILSVSNKNFKTLLSTLASEEKKRATNSSESSRARKIRRVSRGPILIVVPATFSACINMYNAQDFFDKGTYTSPQDARKKNPVKPEAVFFSHRMSSGKKIDFKVIDAAETLNRDQYSNIGATIMQGADWQFADWHWKNPATIFNKSRGFYFHKEQVPPHKNTKIWNVEIMMINTHAVNPRKKRLDTLLWRKFWTHAEDFLRKHKPELLVEKQEELRD